MQTRKYEWKRELGVCPYGHVVLAEHLTYDTALAIESLYIKVIGRAPDGPLLNKVSYGNWQDVRSPETRAKIGRKGRKCTEAQKANIKASAQGRIQTKEANQKRREALLGKKRPPFSADHRAKISAARTGTKQPPASAQLRELRRANMLRIWKDRREQRC